MGKKDISKLAPIDIAIENQLKTLPQSIHETVKSRKITPPKKGKSISEEVAKIESSIKKKPTKRELVTKEYQRTREEEEIEFDRRRRRREVEKPAIVLKGPDPKVLKGYYLLDFRKPLGAKKEQRNLKKRTKKAKKKNRITYNSR